MRNLFENNDSPDDETTDYSTGTKTVRISHNGVDLGLAEVSVFGDIVGMRLNTDGAQLVMSRLVLQVTDI